MSKLFMGLDLGQVRDYTALAIIEKVKAPDKVSGEVASPDSSAVNADDASPYPAFHVRYLERFPLGTSYTDVVRRVADGKKELEATSGNRVPLVVDATGVGTPVVDMFRAAGLCPISVWIHGGEAVSQEGLTYRVPKRDLAGVLQVLFQSGRIKVARELREGETLLRELQNFRVKINIATGHDSYEAWREGDHDDLVLAVALACWYAARAGERRPHASSVSMPRRTDALLRAFNHFHGPRGLAGF